MNKIFYVTMLSITILLSGCGLTAVQQEGVSRFAKASGGLGEFSVTTFSELREATIQMNTMSIAVRGNADITNLDESFDSNDIATRIGAATALTSYGSLLLALVENTQEEELKQASDKFVDSFKNASNTKLDDDQLESLGILVQGIGGLFVEYKKAEAVTKIVLDTESDVNLICDLLIKDFGRTSLGLAQGLDVTIKRLKTDADIALAKTNGDKANIQGRLIAIEAYRLADTNDKKLDIVMVRAINTLKALKTANTQLVAAIEDDSQSISEIKAIGVKFKNLSDALRVFANK